MAMILAIVLSGGMVTGCLTYIVQELTGENIIENVIDAHRQDKEKAEAEARYREAAAIVMQYDEIESFSITSTTSTPAPPTIADGTASIYFMRFAYPFTPSSYNSFSFSFRLVDIDGVESTLEVNPRTRERLVHVPAGRALDIRMYVLYHSDKPGYRRLGVFSCPPLEAGKTYKVWYERNYTDRFSGAGRLILTYSDVKSLTYDWDGRTKKSTPEYTSIYEQEIPPLTEGIPGWRRPDAAPAPDGTALWTGNGHQYLLVEQNMTWDEANDYAKKQGGYLATVTSKEEQTFIEELIKKENKKLNFWLGGYREGRAWVWATTGEPWKYANWMKKRPDRDPLYKNAALCSVIGSYQRQEGSRDFQWENMMNPKDKCGLIIEWDE